MEHFFGFLFCRILRLKPKEMPHPSRVVVLFMKGAANFKESFLRKKIWNFLWLCGVYSCVPHILFVRRFLCGSWLFWLCPPVFDPA